MLVGRIARTKVQAAEAIDSPLRVMNARHPIASPKACRSDIVYGRRKWVGCRLPPKLEQLRLGRHRTVRARALGQQVSFAQWG